MAASRASGAMAASRRFAAEAGPRRPRRVDSSVGPTSSTSAALLVDTGTVESFTVRNHPPEAVRATALHESLVRGGGIGGSWERLAFDQAARNRACGIGLQSASVLALAERRWCALSRCDRAKHAGEGALCGLPLRRLLNDPHHQSVGRVGIHETRKAILWAAGPPDRQKGTVAAICQPTRPSRLAGPKERAFLGVNRCLGPCQLRSLHRGPSSKQQPYLSWPDLDRHVGFPVPGL